MSCLRGVSSLSICELATIASSTALLLSQNQTTEDLETLGNLVSTIGGMILTFASSQVIPSNEENCKECEKSREITNKIDTSIERTIRQQQSNSIFNNPDKVDNNNS